mgnify:CR=1 FL=1
MNANNATHADTAHFTHQADHAMHADTAHFVMNVPMSDTVHFSHQASHAHYADSSGFAHHTQHAEHADTAHVVMNVPMSDTSGFALEAKHSEHADTSNFTHQSGHAVHADTADHVDGVTTTVTELNYVDGVTSSIQDQLDAKQAADDDLTDLADGTLSASKVENAITSAGTDGQVWTSDGEGAGVWEAVPGATLTGLGIIATASELNMLDSVTATVAELNYVDGVTSAVQDQLDGKQAADADLTDLADGTLSASKVQHGEYFISSAGTSGQVWTLSLIHI